MGWIVLAAFVAGLLSIAIGWIGDGYRIAAFFGVVGALLIMMDVALLLGLGLWILI